MTNNLVVILGLLSSPLLHVRGEAADDNREAYRPPEERVLLPAICPSCRKSLRVISPKRRVICPRCGHVGEARIFLIPDAPPIRIFSFPPLPKYPKWDDPKLRDRVKKILGRETDRPPLRNGAETLEKIEWSESMKAKIPVIFGLLAAPLLMGGLPTWLLKSEVLIVLTAALVYGFSAFAPKLPSWATCQEVRGVTLVALGCVCLFVPTQFILSALLVGIGARLVMSADRKIGKPSTVTSIRQQPGEIVIRETTPMEKVR